MRDTLRSGANGHVAGEIAQPIPRPHRSYLPGWSDRSASGASTIHLLHPRPGSFTLRRLHRLRQHPQRQPSDPPANDCGQLALLGPGGARGWVPIRPRVDPLSRCVRPRVTKPSSGTSNRTRRARAPSPAISTASWIDGTGGCLARKDAACPSPPADQAQLAQPTP